MKRTAYKAIDRVATAQDRFGSGIVNTYWIGLTQDGSYESFTVGWQRDEASEHQRGYVDVLGPYESASQAYRLANYLNSAVAAGRWE